MKFRPLIFVLFCMIFTISAIPSAFATSTIPSAFATFTIPSAFTASTIPSVFATSAIFTNDEEGKVDDSFDTRTFPVTIAEIIDSPLTDVNVTVDFEKSSDEICPSEVSDDSHSDEISMSIQSPEGTIVYLVYDFYTGGALTTYFNFKNAQRSIVTFDDSATDLVGTTTDGLPESGTFHPAEPLSVFNDESPLGNWIFTYGDSGLLDALCLYTVQLELTVVAPSDGKTGGCADCIAPTFGKNQNNVLLVENGYTYNGVSTDVTDYHTEFDLITAVTGVTNTVIVKAYENNGVNNIRAIQFGLGVPAVGSPLHDAQTLVEVLLDSTDIEEIIQIDENNLVDIVRATTDVVDCIVGDSRNCLEVTLQYVYRDQPKYNVMAINAMDGTYNTQTNYLNDGILVVGESLNEPLHQEVEVSKAGVFYPQKTGITLLSLIDYKTDMWQDEYGYLWSSNEHGFYIVDTIPVPQREADKYSQWHRYDRNNSEFEAYKELQIDKAMQTYYHNSIQD